MPEPEAKDKVPEVGKTAASGNGAGESEKTTAIPAGVVPLFFSGAGQRIFECVVDQDVTPESPNKLIPKKKILDDLLKRAAVSDFHPVKKKVQVRNIYIMPTTNKHRICKSHSQSLYMQFNSNSHMRCSRLHGSVSI